jgi:hypothetical protein
VEDAPLCHVAEAHVEETPLCHVSEEKFQELEETGSVSPLERYLICFRG